MSSAITGSAALTDLQNNLKKLSAQLHDISTMMNTDMTKIGDVWQDSKYQEFMEAYKPQIQNCQHISERYDGWCTNVLQPTIDNVIEVEKTDVSFDGGTTGASVGGGTSAGTASGVASQAGTAAQAPSIGKNFNLGGNSSTLGGTTLGATKNNPLSALGGNPTYGNLSEEQRIEKWEKENGQSLDSGRYTIDENGKTIPRTNFENGAGSSSAGSGINAGSGSTATPSAEQSQPLGTTEQRVENNSETQPSGESKGSNAESQAGISPDAQKIVNELEKDKTKQGATTQNPDAQKIVDALNKDKADKGANEGASKTSPQASQEDGAMLHHLREEEAKKSALNNGGANVVDNPTNGMSEEQRIKDWEEKKQMSLDRERLTVDEKGNAVPRSSMSDVMPSGSASTSEEQRIKDWEEKNQMSLDRDRLTIDTNGNAVPRSQSEATGSTNLEDWKNGVLEPSAPNSGNEPGAISSQMLNGKDVTGIQSGGDTTIVTNEETKVFAPNIEQHTHTHEEQTNVFVDNSVTETKVEQTQNVSTNNVTNNITNITNNTTNNTTVNNIYMCDNPEHHHPAPAAAPADVQAQPPVQPASPETKPTTGSVPFPDPTLEPEPKPVRRVVPRPVPQSAPAPEPEPAPEPRPRPVPPRHRPSYVHNDPTPRPVRPDPRGPDYDHTPNPRPNPRVHHSIPEDSPRPNNQHNSVSAPPRRPSPIRPLGKGSRAR